MATVNLENVGDFVADTLKELGAPDFTDISSDLTEHVAMDEILQENHALIGSGNAIQFNVLVAQSRAARHVSLAEPDNVNQVDGMIQGGSVWRMTQTSYMLIHQLVSMNKAPSLIVDFVRQQRLMALISLAELMEQAFWSPPSATDLKTPYGIPYWITKSSTKGFTGGVLSGYSNIANVSPTNWPRWQNWVAPYTNVSRDDMIRAIREASIKTKFKPSVPGIPSPNTGDKYGYYCGYPVYQPFQESLENQNDNLGKDVAPMDNGEVMFKGVPVRYVPFLNSDTTNPFYGINWGWMKIAIARGEWMRETQIPHAPTSHNVATNFIDMMYNFVSKNRRCHFVASNGATYPG